MYVATENSRVIGYSETALDYCNEPVSNWEDVADQFNDGMEGIYVRNGIATFEPTERDNEVIAERTAKAQREAKLAAIVDSYSETFVQSDKLGQLWKIVKLGEVEILREYVPDPDPHGTADNPFDYAAGVVLFPNAYYMHEGVRYVFVGVTQRTAVDWATDSADMEEF